MVFGIHIPWIMLNFSQLSVAATDLIPSFGKGPLKSVVAKARSCALKALGCTLRFIITARLAEPKGSKRNLMDSKFVLRGTVFVDLKYRDRKLMHVRAHHLLQ